MRLRNILERLTIPYFWVDNTGCMTWCNGSGKSVLENTPSNLWAEISQSLPPGYIYNIHDGDWPDKGFLVECVPDGNAGVNETLRDIREQNAQLELIFQEVFDEIYVTDGNGVTLRVNRATERLYGLPQEELIGRSVYELEQEGIFYPSGIAQVLRRRTQVTVLQTTKDGKRLISTATPVFDHDGHITLVISTAKDVSEIPWLEPSFVEEASGHHQPALAENIMLSEAPEMKSVVRLAERLAPTEATLLLLGETGVGKNRLAEYIHQSSSRRNEPFIDVNCAAIPESLLESELFGYEGGAFTGALKSGKPGKVELANRGTLFLNEIGELPLHLQGKLLDFIQDRTLFRVGGVKARAVDTRILAATNRNLQEMVDEGSFRADLFYRLNVVPIQIPPLRNRVSDILDLAMAFLARFSAKYRQSTKDLAKETCQFMSMYSWPGNVRELENLMERLVLTVDEHRIQPYHLPEPMRNVTISGKKEQQGRPMDFSRVPANTALSTFESPLHLLDVMERTIYKDALQTYQSTYEIAKVLGVSQPTVVRKIKQFGLR